VGGIDSSQVEVAGVDVYDPVGYAWSIGVPLPNPIFGATPAVVRDTLYVFGGYTSDNVATDQVWAFNPHRKTRSAKAPMLTAQGSARAVVSQGIIYVIGGNTNNQNRIATVEGYDPMTDSWTAQPSLRNGKSELSAGVLDGTTVAADRFATNGDNESFTLGATNWSALPNDPGPRNGTCTGVIRSKFHVSGGNRNDANTLTSLNEPFSLATNAWKDLAPMQTPGTAAGFAVYGGKLYCIGGGGSGVPF
jgi:N-acetylneuraminic acid mutarotase